MFNPLHSILNEEQFKKHLCNSRISKEKMSGCINDYHLKSEISIMLRCRLCSTCYTAVRIKNCLKSTFAIKIATMTNTDDFHYAKGSHHVLSPNRHFAVSKDEWDTKEDTGKSMKKALHILWYAIRHLSGQSIK